MMITANSISTLPLRAFFAQQLLREEKINTRPILERLFAYVNSMLLEHDVLHYHLLEASMSSDDFNRTLVYLEERENVFADLLRVEIEPFVRAQQKEGNISAAETSLCRMIYERLGVLCERLRDTRWDLLANNAEKANLEDVVAVCQTWEQSKVLLDSWKVV